VFVLSSFVRELLLSSRAVLTRLGIHQSPSAYEIVVSYEKRTRHLPPPCLRGWLHWQRMQRWHWRLTVVYIVLT